MVPCNSSEAVFHCDTSTCVPHSSLCNGIPDCYDGKDESVAQCGEWNGMKPRWCVSDGFSGWERQSYKVAMLRDRFPLNLTAMRCRANISSLLFRLGNTVTFPIGLNLSHTLKLLFLACLTLWFLVLYFEADSMSLIRSTISNTLFAWKTKKKLSCESHKRKWMVRVSKNGADWFNSLCDSCCHLNQVHTLIISDTFQYYPSMHAWVFQVVLFVLIPDLIWLPQ
jgi:hypothetical protein